MLPQAAVKKAVMKKTWPCSSSYPMPAYACPEQCRGDGGLI